MQGGFVGFLAGNNAQWGEITDVWTGSYTGAFNISFTGAGPYIVLVGDESSVYSGVTPFGIKSATSTEFNALSAKGENPAGGGCFWLAIGI